MPAFFYYIQPSPGSTHLTVSDCITKRNKNRFSSTFPPGKVPGTALFTYCCCCCCCFVLSAARCFFNVVNLQKMSNSVAPRGHRGRRCCEPRETMQFACFIKATRGERLQWRLYCMNPESVGAICHSTLKPVTYFLRFHLFVPSTRKDDPCCLFFSSSLCAKDQDTSPNGEANPPPTGGCVERDSEKRK